MPSVFDTMVANETGAFLGEFGEDVLIKLSTDDESAARTIKAVVPRENRASTAEMQGANVFNQIFGVHLSASNTDGVANLKEFAQNGTNFHQIKVDGIWWNVARVTQWNVGGMHECTIEDAAQQNH